jgi:hypothetical protein
MITRGMMGRINYLVDHAGASPIMQILFLYFLEVRSKAASALLIIFWTRLRSEDSILSVQLV